MALPTSETPPTGWRRVRCRAMTAPPSRALARPLADRRFVALLWLIVGAAGWLGILVIGAGLASSSPPKAGFDLDLLLSAGRRVAAGLSPYDTTTIGANAGQAEGLFYSYPPPVAQAFALAAGVRSPVMLVLWALAAAAGLAAVAVALARRISAPASTSEVVLPVLALAPYWFPFAIALLFGNLDASFPFLYGLMLVGALRGGTFGAVLAGTGLALASLKLHPALLVAWFLGLALVARMRPAGGASPAFGWRALGVGAFVIGAIVALSLLVGGLAPWRDFLDVVRIGSGAALIDRRNIGPASQLSLLLGSSEAMARGIQIVVSLLALAVTLWAALRRRDLVESFGWASAASLVTLPVTWFHYPAALLPVGIAAFARSRGGPNERRNAMLLGIAILVGFAALVAPVILWIGVGLVVLAARASVPALESST